MPKARIFNKFGAGLLLGFGVFFALRYAGIDFVHAQLTAQIDAGQRSIIDKLKPADKERLLRLEDLSTRICENYRSAAYKFYITNDDIIPSFGALLCNCPGVIDANYTPAKIEPEYEDSLGECKAKGILELFDKAKIEIDRGRAAGMTSTAIDAAVRDSNNPKHGDFANYRLMLQYSELVDEYATTSDDFKRLDMEQFVDENIYNPDEHTLLCENCAFKNSIETRTPIGACCQDGTCKPGYLDTAANTTVSDDPSDPNYGKSPYPADAVACPAEYFHVDQLECNDKCGKGEIKKTVVGGKLVGDVVTGAWEEGKKIRFRIEVSGPAGTEYTMEDTMPNELRLVQKADSDQYEISAPQGANCFGSNEGTKITCNIDPLPSSGKIDISFLAVYDYSGGCSGPIYNTAYLYTGYREREQKKLHESTVKVDCPPSSSSSSSSAAIKLTKDFVPEDAAADDWVKNGNFYERRFAVTADVGSAYQGDGYLVDYIENDNGAASLFTVEVPAGCRPEQGSLFACNPVEGKLETEYVLRYPADKLSECYVSQKNVFAYVAYADGQFSEKERVTKEFDCPKPGAKKPPVKITKVWENKKIVQESASDPPGPGWLLNKETRRYEVVFRFDIEKQGRDSSALSASEDADIDVFLRDLYHPDDFEFLEVIGDGVQKLKVEEKGTKTVNNAKESSVEISKIQMAKGELKKSIYVKFIGKCKNSKTPKNTVLLYSSLLGEDMITDSSPESQSEVNAACKPTWTAGGAANAGMQLGYCCNGSIQCDKNNSGGTAGRISQLACDGGSFSTSISTCTSQCLGQFCCAANRKTGEIYKDPNTGTQQCADVSRIPEGFECQGNSQTEDFASCSADPTGSASGGCCGLDGTGQPMVWMEQGFAPTVFEPKFECCEAGRQKTANGETVCCPNASDELKIDGNGLAQCKRKEGNVRIDAALKNGAVVIATDDSQVLGDNTKRVSAVKEGKVYTLTFDISDAENKGVSDLGVEVQLWGMDFDAGTKAQLNGAEMPAGVQTDAYTNGEYKVMSLALSPLQPGAKHTVSLPVKIREEIEGSVIAYIKVKKPNKLVAQLSSSQTDPASVQVQAPVGVADLKIISGVDQATSGRSVTLEHGKEYDFHMMITNDSDFGLDKLDAWFPLSASSESMLDLDVDSIDYLNVQDGDSCFCAEKEKDGVAGVGCVCEFAKGTQNSGAGFGDNFTKNTPSIRFRFKAKAKLPLAADLCPPWDSVATAEGGDSQKASADPVYFSPLCEDPRLKIEHQFMDNHEVDAAPLSEDMVKNMRVKPGDVIHIALKTANESRVIKPGDVRYIHLRAEESEALSFDGMSAESDQRYIAAPETDFPGLELTQLDTELTQNTIISYKVNEDICGESGPLIDAIQNTYTLLVREQGATYDTYTETVEIPIDCPPTVEKTADKDSISAGSPSEEVTYTLKVSNPNEQAIPSFEFVDTYNILAKLKGEIVIYDSTRDNISGGDAKCSFVTNSKSIECEISNLPGGDFVTVEYTLTLDNKEIKQVCEEATQSVTDPASTADQQEPVTLFNEVKNKEGGLLDSHVLNVSCATSILMTQQFKAGPDMCKDPTFVLTVKNLGETTRQEVEVTIMGDGLSVGADGTCTQTASTPDTHVCTVRVEPGAEKTIEYALLGGNAITNPEGLQQQMDALEISYKVLGVEYGFEPKEDMASVIEACTPNLSMTKTLDAVTKADMEGEDSPTFKPGEAVDFTITVVNDGAYPLPKHQLLVSDRSDLEVTPGTGCESATPNTFTCVAEELPINEEDGTDPNEMLAPGESMNFQGKMTLTEELCEADSALKNRAKVSLLSKGAGGDLGESDEYTLAYDEVEIPVNCDDEEDIVVTKEADPTELELGEEVEYVLTVTNNGEHTAKPVILDVLPESPIQYEVALDDEEHCSVGNVDDPALEDRQVIRCEELPVESGGSVEITYTLTIKQEENANDPDICPKEEETEYELENQVFQEVTDLATGESRVVNKNASATVTVHCPDPDIPGISIQKTFLQAKANCRSFPYKIVVTNNGTADRDVKIVDTIENNFAITPDTDKEKPGAKCALADLTGGGCTVNIPKGGKFEVSYSLALPEDFFKDNNVEGESFVNTAQALNPETDEEYDAAEQVEVQLGKIAAQCNQVPPVQDPGACCVLPNVGPAQNQPALGNRPGIANQPGQGGAQPQQGGAQQQQPQNVQGQCAPAVAFQQCAQGTWVASMQQCQQNCSVQGQQQQTPPGQAAGEGGGQQAGQAAGGQPGGGSPGGGSPGGGSPGGGSPGGGNNGSGSDGGDDGPDPPNPVCGNGAVEAAEECDDGNKTNNDGCSSTCKLEPCGNGVIDPGEECDNGARNVDTPLSGRSSRGSGLTPAIPTVGTGVNPYADVICRKDCTLARCGDGIKDQNEECDDGNNKSLDGCSKICLIEPSICGDAKVDKDNGEVCDNGSRCVPDPYTNPSNSSSSSLPVVVQSSSRSSLTNVPLAAQLLTGGRSSVSGNGKTECISDDDCRPGTVCQYDLEKDKLCTNECLRVECGNGKIEGTEECDDKNKVSGDGCTAECKQEICGDGTVQAPRGEACDNGSVCRIGTALNDKFTCRKDTDCRVCIGVPGTGEKRCGGDAAGLACTQDSECAGTAYTCEYNVNKDKFCNNLCARIVTVCGNKVEELGEECDDGNSLDGDGCSKKCLKEFCGDAITDTKKGEQCDNGSVCNLNPSQDCRKDADCRKCTRIEGTDVNRCGGDPSAKICGVDADCADIEALKCVYDTEQDKGCSAECKRTNAGLCGNGTPEPGEECDDGNALSGDGCSVSCKNEFCGDAVIQSCSASSAPMPGMTMLCEQCDNGSICSQNASFTCLRDEDCRTCREIPNTNPNIPNVLKRCGGDPKSIPCQVDADCVNTTFSCDYNASKDLTCNNLCVRQGGSSSSSSSSSLPPFCGDGSKQYNEQCDNGKVCRIDNELKSSFACVNDSDCRVCIAAPGTDLKYCGGDADSYPCTKNTDCTKYEYTCEYNVPKNPLCTPECRLTVCGDGVEEGVEECDDGNSRDQDGCDKTCKDEFCGDAKVQPNLNGEVCDNGSVCSTDPTRTCRQNEDCRVCSKISGTSVSRCGGDPLGKLCNYNSECSGETAIVCQYNLTKDAKCGPDCKRGGSSSAGSVGSQSSTSSTSNSSSRSASSNPNPSSASSTSTPDPSSSTPNSSSTSNPSSRSSTSSVSSNTAICGNGIPEPPEECDYGDAGAEDGCSPACLREFCGDGVLQKKLGEMCDNGSVCNQNSTLSCRKDTDCRKCLPVRNTNPDLPNILKRCGGDPYGQACELDTQCVNAPFLCKYDGNKNPACDEMCQTSSVPTSSRSSVSTSSRSSVSSTSSTSSIKTLCGDKIKEGSEECDDGNNADQDGCDKTCRNEFCGDGLVQPNFNNEQCDNGSVCSTDPTKACRNNDECRVCLKIAGTEASRCGGDPRGKLCATNEECKDEAGILCVYNSAKNLLCTNECQSLARSSSSSSRTSQSSTSSSSSSSTSSSSSSSSTSSSSSSSSSLRGCVRDVDCNDGNNYCTYDVCVNGVCQYNPVICPPDLFCDPTRGYCVCPPNLIFCPAQNRCLPPPGDCGTPVGFCGNGLVEPPEQCDDANPFLGDGCRPDCTVELVIPPGPDPEPPLPPIAVCGDGVLQYPEQCEDGNSRPNDGCSLTCQLERVGTTGGIGSTIGGTIGGVGGTGGQQYRCGDGILVRGEQCDDGNTLSGDGCDVACRVETPLVRPPLPACGNGRLDKGEECDDGNLFAGDGCGSACFTERGFCGDGLVQQALGEQCEPTVSTYSSLQCGQNCRYLLRFCGNGRLEPGEECDDGNGNSNSPSVLCRPDCRRARCGDSIRDASEQCDDGNNVSGDSCSFDCRSELLPNFPVVKSPDDGTSSTNVSGEGGRPVNTLPSFPLQPRQPGVGTVPPIITALPPNLYTLPLGQQGANAGAGGTQGRIEVQQRQDQQVRQVTSGKPPQGETGPAALAVMGAGAAAGWAWMRRRRGVS